MTLAITQVISSVMINLVQLIGILSFIAVAKTNIENTMRKTPTGINVVLFPVSNSFVNTEGMVTNKTPVIPELIALVSNTFFSVIISSFYYSKVQLLTRLWATNRRQDIDIIRQFDTGCKTYQYIYNMNYKQTMLQALIAFCEDRGLDSTKIVSLSGFSIAQLMNSRQFEITDQQIENVWRNIVQLSKDQLIGLHFGATMQLAALNIVGQIIQTSCTVRDALLQVRSLMHFVTDLYTMEIDLKHKTCVIEYHKNGGFDHLPITQRQFGDFLIAFTIYELKGLLLKNLSPTMVGLPNFQRESSSAYETILRCSARKSTHYTVEFPKEYLDFPIITANYEIQTLLINKINQLQNPNELMGSLSKRIFNYLIANSYLYSLSIEAVAGNFNVSVRTLQRKLKDEGASYIQIVEEVRKSLAIHYMQNTTSSVKEISIILGYAEPSAFVRAFKKWTGETPTGYRLSSH